MRSNGTFGIRGHLIDAPEAGKLRARRDGALVVENGCIAEIGDYQFLKKKPRNEPIRWLHSDRVVLIPGLIDLHTHLPQLPAVARGQSDLLPWLRQHIFPLEREFTGPKSRRESPQFFAELARHGTTTAMVQVAIFEESCDAAFEAAAQSGLRIVMGKMMMDVGSYGAQQPSKAVSLSLHESERLCRKWNGAGDGLLDYAFSPRFAVSCSEKMMRGVAELARPTGACIQTHLAENSGEIEKVRHQFAWARDYTDVYEQCGLLTPRTVLAHCVHLSDREREAIAASGARVAHCPTANLFLRSGIMPLDQMLGTGICVGLGSDVAAGPELNLWQVMRSAIESQKARSFFEPARVPTPVEVFHLATMGGATALRKEGAIGSFEIGKEADLVAIDLAALLPYRNESRLEADLSPEDVLSLCIYRGGPHAVLETFVRGRAVYQAPQRELFGL
jgi:guanine deaminase